ncbi:MAG: hypothetical protein PHI02_09305 [Sulfurovaceae bacterium]|nr:hypothetical protein [Sulfurovaceae bacterium]
MATIFEITYDAVKLTDEHVKSLGEVINTTIKNDLTKIQNTVNNISSDTSNQVQQIVNSSTKKIETLLNQMSNDVNNISSAISSLNTGLSSLISTQFEEVLSQLEISTQKITEYQEKLEEILSSSIDDLNNKIDDNMQTTIDYFKGMQIFVRDRFGELTEYVGILFNATKDYIKENTNEIIGKVDEQTKILNKTISQAVTDIVDNATKNMEEIKTFISGEFETLVDSLKEMSDSIIAQLNLIWSDIKTLIQSINSPTLKDRIDNLVQNYQAVQEAQKQIKPVELQDFTGVIRMEE